MHTHPNLPLSMLTTLALALASSGCFSPTVTDLGSEGSSSGGEPSTTTETEAETTTSSSSSGVDPDDSSGAPPAVCGDGVVEGDEVCDDGVNDGAYGGCNADCTALGPFCGDGVQNGGEDCDDGDAEDGNGCNVDCVVSGSVLWTVTYDGPAHGSDVAHGVTTDSVGDVVVSGTVYGNSGLREGWLRKYSSEGSAIWTADITNPDGPSFNGPVTSLANDEIVVGGNYDPGNGSRDAWLWQISVAGQTVWTRTHASPQNGWDVAVAIDTDGSGYFYVLFEESNAPTETGYRTFIRKYTPDGSEVWTQIQASNERARHIEVNPQGHIMIAGTRIDGGTDRLWFQRKDSDGVDLWTQTPALGGATSPSALAMNDNGEFAVAVTPPSASPRIVRFASNGDETDTMFPHPEAPLLVISDAHLENNGNLILGGTILFSDQDVYGWVSKYGLDGAELWTNTHDGAFDSPLSFDSTLALAMDPDGNIIAAGTINDVEGSLSDVWVAKYAP